MRNTFHPKALSLGAPCLLLSCFITQGRHCVAQAALGSVAVPLLYLSCVLGSGWIRSLKAASAAWNLASEKLFKKQRILLTFTEYNFFSIVMFGER